MHPRVERTVVGSLLEHSLCCIGLAMAMYAAARYLPDVMPGSARCEVKVVATRGCSPHNQSLRHSNEAGATGV